LNNEGKIIHTFDGGENWYVQKAPVYRPLFAVFFIDSNHGWVVGDGDIYRTTDGGIHWTFQPSETSMIMRDVSFPSPECGWIVGDNGTILKITSSASHPRTPVPTACPLQNYPNPFTILHLSVYRKSEKPRRLIGFSYIMAGTLRL
jgi:photosystem II stability/assembly factor-like uncharacterized protein